MDYLKVLEDNGGSPKKNHIFLESFRRKVRVGQWSDFVDKDW